MKLHKNFWEHLALVMVLFILAVAVFAMYYPIGNQVVGSAKATEGWCQDSDRGLTYNTKGIVMDYQENTFIDICKGSSILREGYCSMNKVNIEDHNCRCIDGACLS